MGADELLRKKQEKEQQLLSEKEETVGNVPLYFEGDKSVLRSDEQDKEIEQELQSQVQNIEKDFEIITPAKTAEVKSDAPKTKKLDSKSKRKSYVNRQKEATSKGYQGLLNAEEISTSRELVKGADAEIYNEVKSGDFKRFEKLTVPLRNALATEYMNNVFKNKIKDDNNPRTVALIFKEEGTAGLLNPLLRLGISLGMRSGLGELPPKFFKALDDELNKRVMINTLESSVNADGISQADLTRNAGSQIFIAKNLYLAHLGKLSKITGSDKSPWDASAASAFAHCSRVNYIMPALTAEAQRQEHQTMWNVFEKAEESGLFSRGSSTHGIQRRRVDNSKPAKELKKKFNFSGQRGMNVAIGGLGRTGVSGQKILNNGTCGHIYSMRKDADVGICGGYLVGFESDEYKKTNQLGHTHDMLATGEKSSSFGGQRSDEIGNKYGGRQVDLSHLSAKEITEKLDKFENVFRNRNLLDEVEAERFLDMLTGSVMSEVSMELFENNIETYSQKINQIKAGGNN